MFSKILIANRGEIACRIIKTAKKMSISTVAIYSDADENALHVRLADEAVHIGGSPSNESYLVSEHIINAALKTGAQAIHPGYGFLSENAKFAQACADNQLIFIGPPIKAIESMGSKSAAKNIMEKAKVPLVPGYHGNDQDPATIKQAADAIGYPVLLKAIAGGGGKGMRQVWNGDEFDQALGDAKRESMASFGNDDMLVEKYLTQPRHVEVQVFCDQHGNGVYLFERDCSVQRRHQKIIEEAPAPNISDTQRQAMGETAVRAAQAIDYQGAGTVEFLLDIDDSFYFMEMNTRLQVEHPVSEMITGQDLVEWQLKAANGDALPLAQDELTIRGHAFEARIYAEDPSNQFLPTTGTLSTLRTPQETEYVRIDTGVVEGDTVSPFYDPMIAKLIVWGEDRSSALARLIKSLRDYQIAGVTTNLSFLHDLASSEPFAKAELDTGFIDTHQQLLFAPKHFDLQATLVQAGLYLVLANQEQDSNEPWNSKNSWRMNQSNTQRFDIRIGDTDHSVTVEQSIPINDFVIHFSDQSINAKGQLEGERLRCKLNDHNTTVMVSKNGDQENFIIFNELGSIEFQRIHADYGDHADDGADDNFNAPMNGTIVEVLVEPNTQVAKGQAVIIMEAMKMQHTMHAPSDGMIIELFCKAGDLVDGGMQLLNYETSEKD